VNVRTWSFTQWFRPNSRSTWS